MTPHCPLLVYLLLKNVTQQNSDIDFVLFVGRCTVVAFVESIVSFRFIHSLRKSSFHNNFHIVDIAPSCRGMSKCRKEKAKQY